MVLYIFIGIGAGLISGLFGVGGGIIIVPALVYYAGLTQHQAVGTSLAVLLPPVGLAAVIEYYRHGNVDVKAAVCIVLTMFFAAWLSAHFAQRVNQHLLKLGFGFFLVLVGLYYSISSYQKLYSAKNEMPIEQSKG